MPKNRMVISPLIFFSGFSAACRIEFPALWTRRMRICEIDMGANFFQLFLRAYLVAQMLFLLFEVGRHSGAEVYGFEHGTDFDFGSGAEGAALEPFDGLFYGADLAEPEAGDEFFGLGEGAVGDGGFGSREGDALAFGAGLEAFGGKHHACFYQLFVELAHVGEELGSGEDACFGVLVCFDDYHATHWCFS